MVRYKHRSVVLDLIRILAISLVLFAHIFQSIGDKTFGGFFGIKNFYWVSWGGVGVTVFLVLSGMSLSLTYNNNTNYLAFIKKRLLRIYPTYWLALLFSIPIYYLRIWYNQGLVIDQLPVTPSGVLCSFTGLCAFVGQWGGPFLNTSWFIGLIVSLYFIFPYLYKLFRYKPVLMLIATLSVSIFTRYILGSSNLLWPRSLDWFPLSRLFEFCFGIYLGINYSDKLSFGKYQVSTVIKKNIHFLSQLSFPIFLVHYPLLFIIPHSLSLEIPFIFGLLIFITLSTGVSAVFHKIDLSIFKP